MLERIWWRVSGATPPIALLFAPVPAYVLSDFKQWKGPPAILLIPAFLAFMAGYLDRNRSAIQAAFWIVAATYLVFAADGLRLAVTGTLPWAVLPLALGGQALWIVVIVGLPTVLCTLLGAWARTAKLRKRYHSGQ